MPKYELVLVLETNKSDDERNTTLERFEELIRKNGGEVHERDSWGKRRLAYPIQKNREAFYFQINFDTPTDNEVLPELNRELRIAEDILRSLVTKSVVGKSKGKPLTQEEMAKINYRPPGSRRPPMGGAPRGPREGGYNRDNRDNRDNRESAPASPAAPAAPAASEAPKSDS